MKKYELTNETIEIFDEANNKFIKLYRIKSLKAFDNIKNNELGGYVEDESNLSHEGNCWIEDDAKVFNDSIVMDNARVKGLSIIDNNSIIKGNAKISGKVVISNNVTIQDKVTVIGSSKIQDGALLKDKVFIFGEPLIKGRMTLKGESKIAGNAKIIGNFEIDPNCYIKGNAIVKNNSDYNVFKNTWSSGRYFTYTKSNKMWSVGCFYGTSEELINKAYKDSITSGNNYKAFVDLVK